MLTPGQEALREAARLEAALVYGRVHTEHRQPTGTAAVIAEAELNEALRRARHAAEQTADQRDLEAALVAHIPVHLIVDRLGVTYSEVRAARKRLMAGAA